MGRKLIYLTVLEAGSPCSGAPTIWPLVRESLLAGPLHGGWCLGSVCRRERSHGETESHSNSGAVLTLKFVL